jgi:hypothetical protein
MLCSIFGQNDTANVGVALEVTVIQVSSPAAKRLAMWRVARGAMRHVAWQLGARSYGRCMAVTWPLCADD